MIKYIKDKGTFSYTEFVFSNTTLWADVIHACWKLLFLKSTLVFSLD